MPRYGTKPGDIRPFRSPDTPPPFGPGEFRSPGKDRMASPAIRSIPHLVAGAMVALLLSGCLARPGGEDGMGRSGAGGGTGSAGGGSPEVPRGVDAGTAPLDSVRQAAIAGAADTLLVTSLHRMADDAGAASDRHCGADPARDGDGMPRADGAVSRRNRDAPDDGGSRSTVIPFACAGHACTAAPPFRGAVSIRETGRVLRTLAYAPIGTVGGVTVVHGVVARDDGSMTSILGGWMRYSFFGSRAEEKRSGGREGPLSGLDAQGVALGRSADFGPHSGLEIHSGAMVGRSADPADAPVWPGVTGDAAVTVDFERRRVDMRFTNVTETDTGRPLPEMAWTGLALSTDGSFGANDPTIRGRLFGGGHAEAAGVFERDRLVGAFGAARD